MSSSASTVATAVAAATISTATAVSAAAVSAATAVSAAAVSSAAARAASTAAVAGTAAVATAFATAFAAAAAVARTSASGVASYGRRIRMCRVNCGKREFTKDFMIATAAGHKTKRECRRYEKPVCRYFQYSLQERGHTALMYHARTSRTLHMGIMSRVYCTAFADTVRYLMTTLQRSQARKRLHTAISKRAFMTNSEHRMVSPEGDPLTWLLDFRSILLDGEVLNDIVALFWDCLKKEQPFQAGGLETAAVALVAGLVMKAKAEGVTLNGFYVRKSRKKDGLQRVVEGTLTDEKIILLDDGLNSGKSLIRQIELLRLLGKEVHAVCVMVRFRDLSFYRYFEESGIRIISLFTLDDFPQTGGLAEYAKMVARYATPLAEILFDVKWKFQSENPGYFHILPKSAPVIDDERVYFGADNGVMWALNQSDGSVAWSYKTLFGAGMKRIFSSPALARGHVYFGAYDGNFYALDAKTGAKRWIYREADWIGSSPCVAEDLGLVFVGLEFGLWRKQGGIAALDLQTGEKRWWQHEESLTHSSPTYSKRANIVVVGSSNGAIFAYDAKTGKRWWTYNTSGAVRAGFALDEERGVVCFGSEDKNIYVLDIRTGTLVHKIETLEPIYSTPLVEDGKLYFGVLDKRMLCIDLDSGSVLWTFWTSSRVFSSPVMVNGRIYFGSNDGRLYELDPKTGAETGLFQATERIVNKIAYNPSTKRFFVPTYANELYCLLRKDADSSEHK